MTRTMSIWHLLSTRQDVGEVRSGVRGTGERGFSLIELLITLLLMTIILGGLYTALFQSQATFDAQQDAMALVQQARVAVDNMAFELRMAGSDIGNLPQAITAADTTQLTFVADVDNGSANPPCGNAVETAVNGGAERVAYSMLAGQLRRTVDCWDGAAWTNAYTNQVMAQDLIGAAPVFRYFDDLGTELVPGAGGLTSAQRDTVTVVSITLTLDDMEDHAVADSFVGFRIFTQVRLRNAGL